MTSAEIVHLHYPSFLTTFVRQKYKTRGHNDVRLYDISVSFKQLKFRTTFCARACTMYKPVCETKFTIWDRMFKKKLADSTSAILNSDNQCQPCPNQNKSVSALSQSFYQCQRCPRPHKSVSALSQTL